MSNLSHIDAAGRARMVDVSDKAVTARTARAVGRLVCAAKTLDLVREGKTPKGAVVSTAELAGVMAAKRTSDLIPLCHPLALTKVVVDIREDADLPGFAIAAEFLCRVDNLHAASFKNGITRFSSSVVESFRISSNGFALATSNFPETVRRSFARWAPQPSFCPRSCARLRTYVPLVQAIWNVPSGSR